MIYCILDERETLASQITALFGYEGQSNVLKVIGTGEDGVEEMAEDLNSSKIMYASLRVVDPNTTRPKVVLINWQGEGAPTLRKGTCARHLNDVNKFLRGVHVTVNARTEEEVEPDVIMAAVLKASATTYNFNERSEINEKTTPVKGLVDTFKRGEASGAAQKPWGPGVTCGEGSYTYPSKMPKPKTKSDMGTNYKRTNPLAEINTKSRNRFWEEQEVEERRRKTEEQTKRDEELKLLESERKQREIDDAKHREVLTKERNARILAERKAEEEAAKRLAAQDEKKWQHDLHNQYEEEQERARRAEMMRMERKKEAESLIGQRMHSTRAMFESASSTSEQNAELNRPPPRKLKEFKPAIDVERTETTEQTANVLPNRGVTARWPPANNTAQKEDTSLNRNKVSDNSIIQNRVKTSPVPSIPKEHNVSEPPKSVSQPPVSQPPVSQPSVSQPPVSQPPVSQQPSSPREVEPVDVVPRQQPHQPQLVQQQQHASSQPHSNGDVSSNGFNDAVVPNKMSPQSHMENGQVGDTTTDAFNGGDDSYVTTIDMSNSASKETVTNSAANPTIGMVYEVDGMEYQILPEHGLCARALYDYQSADSTEITFDPEEIITNIDQIDPGWWQGVGPDGSFGLFPANYVELINSTGV